MTTSPLALLKSGKRVTSRRALAAMPLIERANAQLLGLDEWQSRLRRYVATHDAPASDEVAFERLCLTVFAQGLRARALERHEEALRSAFHGFVPATVARMDGAEMTDPLLQPIIRNRAKVEACVGNARRWISLCANGGTYLARVASVAVEDDALEGWPRLRAMLQHDFRRVGEQTARIVLKRWGFFTALPHPGCARLLERLQALGNGGVQAAVASLAQRNGRDAYAMEAALALFAGLGPCKPEPQCHACILSAMCPSAPRPLAAAAADRPDTQTM
ncbi:MAG: DNA-3-methyladenine glycosylase I [Candidatus Eremiobacteraeota bacterium]|nr:DNA-3-methyladenine glycosylase I [Candidatus Eremiobacteraeota bacterium]